MISDQAGLLSICLDYHEIDLPRVAEPISLASIASHLSEEDDLAAGLVYPPKHKKSTMVMIKDYLGMLAEADNPTAAGRAAAFVSFFGNTAGKVQVEFETISSRLRRQMIESIAREQYGDNAVRVMRFLLDTGKMPADRVCELVCSASLAPTECCSSYRSQK